MRWSPALLSLSLSLAAGLAGAACQNTVKSECSVAADCGPAALCVDGACVDDERVPVLPTEGEGEPFEGEGEKGEEGEGDGGVEGEGDTAEGEGDGGVEGEGDTAEGEGDTGGEGEGDTGGEGEGDTGGEGEGEGDPCGGVTCGEFQLCSAGLCSYDGPVCDAFQNFEVEPFADFPNLPLNATAGSTQHHRADDPNRAGDYFLDAFRIDTTGITNVVETLINDTTSPPPVTLVIDMTADDFDPLLAVVDDSAGICNLIDFNDDQPAGNNRHSRIVLPVEELSFANNNVVATTFAPDTTGTYDLKLRPTLCGLETDSLATFDGCARALSTRDQSCATNNPCERTPAGLTTGFACCIRTGATRTCGRADDAPIIRFRAAGTGATGCDPS